MCGKESHFIPSLDTKVQIAIRCSPAEGTLGCQHRQSAICPAAQIDAFPQALQGQPPSSCSPLAAQAPVKQSLLPQVPQDALEK